MVEIADIEDRESFKTWLEETQQRRKACVALAARAAMRVLPVVWGTLIQSKPYSALPLLRASLIAGVAGLAPSEVLTDREYASALRAAALTAAHAAARAAWAAIRSDCAILQNRQPLHRSPLFPDSPFRGLGRI
jgi:hypothetical protein